jgi:hypothetical protein
MAIWFVAAVGALHSGEEAFRAFGRQQGLRSPLTESEQLDSQSVLPAADSKPKAMIRPVTTCPPRDASGKECSKYVPYGKQYSCDGVTNLQIEIGSLGKSRPLITQGPERSDGPGARAFAIINVMVLAEALGFEYIYAPISARVPHFGPTDLKGAINWEQFLNLGAGFARFQDKETEISFTQLEDISDMFEAKGQKIPQKAAYQLGHAYTFLDHPCWHEQMWGAYAKISAKLSENYAAAEVERPKCPYHDKANTVHVAIHMRRGDVMKGDPEKITRCGKKIFPKLPNDHPRWKSYWMEVS